jgi:hypothetical protein
MIKTIILKLAKYMAAFVVTMFLWNYAGQAISAKDDLANIGGVILYFLMVSGWIWLLGSEWVINEPPSDCDKNCGCSHEDINDDLKRR